MQKSQNILFPVDFTEGSLMAMDYAAAFARENKATIHFLHVVKTGNTDPGFKENMTADHLLDLLLLDERLKGITTKGRIREGQIDDSILSEQHHVSAGLIIMGTLGATGFKKVLFGSHAVTVMQEATIPVLAIPPNSTYRGINKIILATDLNDENLEIANESLDMLRPFNAELDVFYVDTANEMVEETAYRMDHVSTKVKSRIEFPRMTSHISTYKDVNEGLSAYLKKSNADMLMMVTHHRKMMEALFNPSHTKSFFYHAPLPVMAIPYK